MQIEVYHRLKPEIEGDAEPLVYVEEDQVRIVIDRIGVRLTHGQFKEMVSVYQAYAQANITAQEQMKDV